MRKADTFASGSSAEELDEVTHDAFMQVSIWVRGTHDFVPRHPVPEGLSDNREAVRRTAIRFLHRAGLPVTYEPFRIAALMPEAAAVLLKAVPTLIKIFPGLIRAVRAMQRTARQAKRLEYQVQLHLNQFDNALVPTLAVVADLLENLQHRYPGIEFSFLLEGAQEQGRPCTVAIGPGAATDRAILKIIDRVRRSADVCPIYFGVRRRQGWEMPGIKFLRTENDAELWEFMDDLGRVPPLGGDED